MWLGAVWRAQARAALADPSPPVAGTSRRPSRSRHKPQARPYLALAASTSPAHILAHAHAVNRCCVAPAARPAHSTPSPRVAQVPVRMSARTSRHRASPGGAGSGASTSARAVVRGVRRRRLWRSRIGRAWSYCRGFASCIPGPVARGAGAAISALLGVVEAMYVSRAGVHVKAAEVGAAALGRTYE